MGRTEHKGGSRVATEERERESPESATIAPRSRALPLERETLLRSNTSGTRGVRLERKASGPVLDELLLLEMELHRRYQAHLARARPMPSPEKDRILAGLRSKN